MDYRVRKQFCNSYHSLIQEFCDNNELGFVSRMILMQIAEYCDDNDSKNNVFDICLRDIGHIYTKSDIEMEKMVKELSEIVDMVSQIEVWSDIEDTVVESEKLFTKCELFRTSLILYRGYVPS